VKNSSKHKVTFHNSILGLVGVLLLGLAIRLIPYQQVFTSSGIRFFDSDPYYHVLRTHRIVEDYPHVPWDNPMMNYPHGAPYNLPPLFDQLLATVVWLTGSGQGSSRLVEVVAALVPPILGTVTLPLVAALGWLLIRTEAGLVAALVMSILPAHVLWTIVGRPDQHVTETLLSCWIFLAFLASWRQEAEQGARYWLVPAVLGLGITLAFWNWIGSGLYLFMLVSFTAVWYILAPPSSVSQLFGISSPHQRTTWSKEALLLWHGEVG
jgi:dolichyl-diphosphooligosaccharide--protein glycosyltransferase